MTTAANRDKFAQFTAFKEIEAWLADFPDNTGTKNTYASALFRYWNESLSKTYRTISAWIAAVKAQRKEGRDKDDPVIQTKWADEVRSLMKTRKGLGIARWLQLQKNS